VVVPDASRIEMICSLTSEDKKEKRRRRGPCGLPERAVDRMIDVAAFFLRALRVGGNADLMESLSILRSEVEIKFFNLRV
jgi:hypothetical protein